MNKKILIIDDDSGIRYVLERFLGHFFDVTAKPDGEKALTWMLRNKPDLIITDLDMPNVNGIQFIRNIKTSLLLKDLKVIVISGHDNPGLKSLCKDLGIIEYYVKPFNPAVLVLDIYDVFHLEKHGNKNIERLIKIM